MEGYQEIIRCYPDPLLAASHAGPSPPQDPKTALGGAPASSPGLLSSGSLDYMETHCQEPLTLETGSPPSPTFSPSYFSRTFKSLMGISYLYPA